MSVPTATQPPSTSDGIPGWGPRPIRIDCTLIGRLCGFIFSVTVDQEYPDFYHSVELSDGGSSFIFGSEIVFANYVAVSHYDLRVLADKGAYQWRVLLRRVSDGATLATSPWSTDPYVHNCNVIGGCP